MINVGDTVIPILTKKGDFGATITPDILRQWGLTQGKGYEVVREGWAAGRQWVHILSDTNNLTMLYAHQVNHKPKPYMLLPDDTFTPEELAIGRSIIGE